MACGDAGEPRGGCDGACGSQEEKAAISWGSVLSGGMEGPPESGAMFEPGDAAPLRLAVSRCVRPAEGAILPRGLEGFPLSPRKVFQVWGAGGAALDPKDEGGVGCRAAPPSLPELCCLFVCPEPPLSYLLL